MESRGTMRTAFFKEQAGRLRWATFMGLGASFFAYACGSNVEGRLVDEHGRERTLVETGALSARDSLVAHPDPSPQERARFTDSFAAPVCEKRTRLCDTADLVNHRGARNAELTELGHPNTVDGCPDSNSPMKSGYEYIRRLRIWSEEGVAFRPGAEVRVGVDFSAWGRSNYVDVFYTPDAEAEVVRWEHVETIRSLGSEMYTVQLSEAFVLPDDGGRFQAFRASIRYRGKTAFSDGCAQTAYADNDDLVFFVESNSEGEDGLSPLSALRYELVDLGELDPNAGFDVAAMNNRGQIVGSFQAPSSTHPGWLWENGAMRQLDFRPTALNDEGIVVGFFEDQSGVQHALVMDGGLQERLPSLGGRRTRARAINNRGQIVGSAQDTAGAVHGVLWVRDGSGVWTVRPLANENGHLTSAMGIDDAGDIIGTGSTPNGGGAVLYRGETFVLLDPKWGGYTNSFGRDLNEHGQQIGAALATLNRSRSFLWDQGELSELLSLAQPFAHASDINRNGYVVGVSRGMNGRRATAWIGGRTVDLNHTLPRGSKWVLTRAESCNDQGWIAGMGMFEGSPLPFVLKPVASDGVCGNGVLEGFETCDDGNTKNLDGCSSNCAVQPEFPWGAHAKGVQHTDLRLTDMAGYHFTPLVDGFVVGLGGVFRGSKVVRLFETATRTLLAEAEVQSDPQFFSYGGIEPISVSSGKQYTVVVAGGSGFTERRLSDLSFPAVFGSIRIDGSTYFSQFTTDLTTARVWTHRMFGQPDVQFVPSSGR